MQKNRIKETKTIKKLSIVYPRTIKNINLLMVYLKKQTKNV